MATDFTKKTPTTDRRADTAQALRKHNINPNWVCAKPEPNEEGYWVFLDNGAGKRLTENLELVKRFEPWPNDKVKHDVLSAYYGEV